MFKLSRFLRAGIESRRIGFGQVLVLRVRNKFRDRATFIDRNMLLCENRSDSDTKTRQGTVVSTGRYNLASTIVPKRPAQMMRYPRNHNLNQGDAFRYTGMSATLYDRNISTSSR